MSTVGKLVVLKLDGDSSEYGFRATLEISSEGDRPSIEVTGKLPPAPELSTNLSQWQEIYRSLGQQNRIEPIEMTFGGSVNNLEVCRQSASTLRDCMKAWLDSQSFHPINKALDRELSIDEPIRFLIRTQDRYLRHLPWHYWDFFEHYSQAEFALSPLSYKQVNPIKPANKKEKVKILAILGNSAGIDIEKDRSFLENLDENAEVVFLVEKSRQEINNDLWEQSWDILYFAGHSKTLKSKTKEEQGIIEINSHDKLTIDELKYGLQQTINNGLQLAIFNSCDGLGLAHELEQLNLPQLILMRQPVPDQVAQEFLKHFLKAFVGGDSLYVAERKARERLQGLEGEFPCASWLPVICQNPASVPPTWQELLGNENNGINNLTKQLVDNTQVEEGHEDKLLSDSYPPNEDNSDHRINFWHRLGTVFLASTLVTGLVMGVRSRGILEASELSSYDQMLQMRPQEGPDPRLLIVAIKAEDLKLPEQKQRNGRSLSDLALNKLLQKLESYQPRTIGLDIFRPFSVNSEQPGLVNRLGSNQNLFAICHVPEPKSNSSGTPPPPEVPEKRQGFSNVKDDSGKIVRRHLLSMTIPATSSCAAKYALNVKLASHYLGVKVKHTDKWNLQIGKVLFRRLKLNPGAYYKGDTWGTQVMLNYRSYRSPLEIAEIVTLEQVLRDEVKPEKVKDKIVIIGAIHETSDYFYTPYSDAHSPSQKIPGVILQAQMVSQILSAVDGTRPLIMPLPVWQEVLWVWVWLLIAGILIWHFRKLIALCLVGCITIGLLYGICYYFLTQGYWVPFIPAFIGIIAVAICLNIYITYSTQEIS